jgi:hypothetical protein
VSACSGAAASPPRPTRNCWRSARRSKTISCWRRSTCAARAARRGAARRKDRQRGAGGGAGERARHGRRRDSRRQFANYARAATFEDVHGAIDARVRELAGAAGELLHAGRSRNDQVATTLCSTRATARRPAAKLRARRSHRRFSRASARKSSELGTLLAATTHRQPAQPVLLAFWLDAWRSRSCARRALCSAWRARRASCPLGSAALAGSSLPLDRRRHARLGFTSPVAQRARCRRRSRRRARSAARVRRGRSSPRRAPSEELIAWSATPAFGYVAARRRRLDRFELDAAEAQSRSVRARARRTPRGDRRVCGRAGTTSGSRSPIIATCKRPRRRRSRHRGWRLRRSMRSSARSRTCLQRERDGARRRRRLYRRDRRRRRVDRRRRDGARAHALGRRARSQLPKRRAARSTRATLARLLGAGIESAGAARCARLGEAKRTEGSTARRRCGAIEAVSAELASRSHGARVTRVHVVGAAGYAAAEARSGCCDASARRARGAREPQSHAGERVGDVLPRAAHAARRPSTRRASRSPRAARRRRRSAGEHETRAPRTRRTLLAARGARDRSLRRVPPTATRASAVYGFPSAIATQIAGALRRQPRLLSHRNAARAVPLAPLADRIANVVIDAKSGVTGAGRTPAVTSLFAEVDEDVRAYGLAATATAPEIAQELRALGIDAPIVFTPHVVPLKRGMLADVYLRVRGEPYRADASARRTTRATPANPFVRLFRRARAEACRRSPDERRRSSTVPSATASSHASRAHRQSRQRRRGQACRT